MNFSKLSWSFLTKFKDLESFVKQLMPKTLRHPLIKLKGLEIFQAINVIIIALISHNSTKPKKLMLFFKSL